MVFLLFLVSLAVMHYAVTRPKSTSISGPEPPEDKAAEPHSPSEQAPATMPGLAALGRALDEHGRGRTPQPAETPETLEVAKTERAPPSRAAPHAPNRL